MVVVHDVMVDAHDDVAVVVVEILETWYLKWPHSRGRVHACNLRHV